MSKKALGRGLGDLLAQQQAPPRPESSLIGKSKDCTDLGPGLRVLILQKNGLEPQPAQPQQPAHSHSRGFAVKCSLAAADMLILAFVLVWQGTAEAPMAASDAIVCVLAVGFGAWLACLGVWLHFRHF